MIEFTNDPQPAPVFDLDRMRSAVPSYQRSELPRRLRGEWPFPVATDRDAAPAVEPIRIDPREYWHLQRAE